MYNLMKTKVTFFCVSTSEFHVIQIAKLLRLKSKKSKFWPFTVLIKGKIYWQTQKEKLNKKVCMKFRNQGIAFELLINLSRNQSYEHHRRVYFPLPKGLALSSNVILGTKPLSPSTLYSTVMRRPSGRSTRYPPMTLP